MGKSFEGSMADLTSKYGLMDKQEMSQDKIDTLDNETKLSVLREQRSKNRVSAGQREMKFFSMG